MRIVCFLRDAGFPIKSIAALFAEEHPEHMISILIEEQEKILCEELNERQSKLDLIESIKRELKGMSAFSVESIGDIAYAMKTKNKLKRMRWMMILTGIPVTALQWVGIILGITNGLWWLLGLWAAVAIPWGILVSRYYFRHTAYICPECHEVFQPRLKESFFAYHTPRMRRLTCPACGHKNLCLEIYTDGEEKKNG